MSIKYKAVKYEAINICHEDSNEYDTKEEAFERAKELAYPMIVEVDKSKDPDEWIKHYRV